MTRDKAKMKADLYQLTSLKKDFLTAQILELQIQEKELKKKIEFYVQVAGEWGSSDSFVAGGNIWRVISNTKVAIKKIQMKLDLIQRERLSTLVAMRSINPNSK